MLAAQALATEVAGQVFNVATASRITLNETVKILRQLTGYGGEVRYAPERAGDIKHSLADINLARKHLGYEMQVNFQEGLRRTVEWYKSTMKPGLLARS
jgi:UDP-glucose 4-epimerase